ncbi:hypothetical protein SUDANB176_07528 (plasmid) [Streptomyces sp. enrichment culture]|uniref:hypothetical protein n=1 Tax=Streptomyces sp. enrichment culture TaxID=1795815 RepID=UPI003F55A8A4
MSVDLSIDEIRLLAEAETALPAVVQELYSDQLRGGSLHEQDGRRFFVLSDPAGKRIELRLDTAALPQPLVARTFTNTTTDRYVIQLADTLQPAQVAQVLSREVGELLSVRDRAAAGGRVPLENLLAPGALLPANLELSDADLGRVGELNYLATRMNDADLAAAERIEARNRFSELLDDSRLRPQTPTDDTDRAALDQYAADLRLSIIRPHLRSEARAAMAELAVHVEQLNEADARALTEARTARATRTQAPPALGEFPMPGLRPDDTPVPRDELEQAAAAAARERTVLSSRTLDELRAEQAALPEGRYPSYEIMIGGGAALAGRDPNVLLVDARGRWHVDPIEAIVQSADQVRHLRQSGMGDPYQFADPQQRVPLPALQLWEDTAAARGPLVDGRAELSISAEGRLIAEITPADGSPPVKVEVQGSPLIATGIPPEIIPGASRQVPTVPEAIDALAERLATAGTPEAADARDRLLALSGSEGSASAALDLLARPQIAAALPASDDTRVTAATETLRATAAWEQARALAPGRVLMGDEVGDGDYDPSVANDWVIAGVGGAAIANAEIILQANPDARVFMVGKDAPFVLHNDAQYTAMRRKHDAEYGGDGRLVTFSGRYLGAVGTVTAPDGRVRLAALDSTGRPLGIEGDAYVACLGRVPRLPQALAPLESWARSSGGRLRGELLFDKDRQYLGYSLEITANGQRHTVDVTGAASRMLPGDVFGRDDMARLAVLDGKTAPPESGNVSAGFMATALQGSQLARHRAAQRGSATPATTGADTVRQPAPVRPSTIESSLALLSDDDLAQHQSGLAHAAQAASERAASAASTARTLAERYEHDGGETVTRLIATGAAPDLIERARTAAAEDVAHAHREAQAAKEQLNNINSRIQQATREAERRAGLTPQQRQAEQAARRQHAAPQPTRTPQAPLPAPKITGPEGPSRGGASV